MSVYSVYYYIISFHIKTTAKNNCRITQQKRVGFDDSTGINKDLETVSIKVKINPLILNNLK